MTSEPPSAPATNDRGADAALALGHRLVLRRHSPTAARHGSRVSTFPQRVSVLRAASNGLHIVQRWLQKHEVDCPLIEGGYKALRQTAIQATGNWRKNRAQLAAVRAAAKRNWYGKQWPTAWIWKGSRASSRLTYLLARTRARPPAQRGPVWRKLAVGAEN